MGYQRRRAQPLVVVAQHPFQLKRPRVLEKSLSWPAEVPPAVLFDPLSTVSATYGVAFQTRFRGGPWSSRPAIFVIDQGGVIRHAGSRPDEDIREEGIFPVLDDLEEQRRLITGLTSKGQERGEAARVALAPFGPRTGTVVSTLVKALKDGDVLVRAGAAAALLWIAPRAGAAVPALTAALEDRDPRVRRLAVSTLGRICSTRAIVEALVRTLADEDARVRAAAFTALEQVGPLADGALQQALAGKDPRLRAAAARA